MRCSAIVIFACMVPTLVALGGATTASASDVRSIDEVISPVRSNPSCKLVEPKNPVSLQAATLYIEDAENGDLRVGLVAKRSESYQCGKQTAVVYLYQYRDESIARETLESMRHLIWGGKGPSSHHPEAVFGMNNVLVVVSTHKPRAFVDLIRGEPEKK